MSIDWSNTALVVFDLDGTLYDQRPVRAAMARALLAETLREGSLRTARILRVYRQSGERHPDPMPDDFCAWRINHTARRCAVEPATVRTTVDQWMHKRPLPLLRRHRVEGLENVFAGLRRTGRRIAIWSDYPVGRKLAALGLTADFELWTGQPLMQRPKPDPEGLRHVLDSMGTSPREALVIGDRFDRDWEAAQRLSIPVFMRSRKRDPRAPTFWRYTDPAFSPIVQER
ncbi:HAD family hydrolase [Qipengyuania sp. XHP0207]|uniref:HAD family hydrolase n=1 Tax=Qipengyuania sp. XHP0207 TaxID=3038078 RepID=UPI00241D7870|nr:HAD family hydrolase [Qipengyuania sp. XHP0207]MDG5747610.1 HAD family hydrolase [Qipengyuania sp. XHP0207]